MQRDEAQNILQLCRPGNEADRKDPLIAEALVMLETDAELRAWFEEQQAFDARITEGLESIEAPADLEAAILAGMRAHALQPKSNAPLPAESAPATQSAAWWRNPWVGIAALFVVMLVIVAVPRGSAPQLAQSDSATLSGVPPVIEFLSAEIDDLKLWDFDKRDEHTATLQAYLASTGAPSPANLPDTLHEMPTIGCLTLDYSDTKLSMICFKDGHVYHLITAKKAGFPDPLPAEARIFEYHDKAFKLWTEGDQVKIFTVHGTKQDIPEFI